MIHDAHAFRGEFIDLCAQIECWAANVIATAPGQPGGKGRKPPHMLGQKLKLIGELAADDTLFANPARIRELLDDIAPLMKLRSDLAHARLSVVADGAQEIYAFELPTDATGLTVTGRFWLKPDETPVLLAALKLARKQLADQKLKG